MIKLKNVSKYYYNKGIISSGINKVNLEFNIGEFVVITGESGSGKSTLLNVLSGLDTYEEGELYINGEETSHYSESDFEEYRKKYISNIFQSFNLINSYTVYQNIELVCLINGHNKKEIKEKVLDLIKQVDLTRYKNTKVSKLSGGQKQRVAIARALAKNTPIIIADEPTGNLDKKSALSVIKTLHEVSKDRLVIVVTHNYEQVMEYATRKITMFDGKVLEDKKIVKTDKLEPKLNEYKKMSRFSEFKLAIRNTFNIIPKFILLLAVFLFMIFAILSEHSSFLRSKYEASKIGFNTFLNNTSDKRIIVNKKSKEAFTEDDYNYINSLNNIDYIIKNDIELDSNIFINNEEIYFDGPIYSNDSIKRIIDYGRLPEKDNEIVIEGSKKNYYLKDPEDLVDKDFDLVLDSFYENHRNVKVVGIIINKELDYNTNFYGLESLANEVNKGILLNRSELSIYLNNQKIDGFIMPLNRVEEGTIYLKNDYNYLCDYSSCKNKKVEFKVHNMYIDNSVTLKVGKLLTKDNYHSLTGNTYDEYSNIIYLNPNDYNKLLTNESYQISVFVKDAKKISDTGKLLSDKDYNAYIVTESLSNIGETFQYFLNIINVVVTIVLIVVMFFISYLIIRLILKSRNFYFTTLRILGSNTKSLKRIMSIELITVLNIAYILTISFIILINKDIIVSYNIKELLSFVYIKNYILIYIILLIMTYLISIRFSNYIFKKSAMKQIREEAN